MKKSILLFLAVALSLALCSCKDSGNPESTDPADTTAYQTASGPFALGGVEFDCSVFTLELTGLTENDDLSVLQNCQKLRTLSIMGSSIKLDNLDFLKYCSFLRELTITGCKVKDISALKNCTQLFEVYLSDNEITDISALSACTNMIEMGLANNKIEDASCTAGMQYLEGLNLSNNKLNNMAFVTELKALKQTLVLDGNNITDLSPLSNISFLAISLASNGISEINISSDNDKVKYLLLNDNNIADVTSLNHFTELISLDLSYNKLASTSALQTLTTLTNLSLAFNDSLSDLSGLNELDNLQNLDLTHCPLLSDNDFSSLPVCEKLYNIKLDANKIGSLAFIRSFKNENTIISIAACGIFSLSELTNLPDNIIYLNLMLNNISDLTPLENSSLTYLYIGNNKITDITPLLTISSLQYTYLIETHNTNLELFVDNLHYNNISSEQIAVLRGHCEVILESN